MDGSDGRLHDNDYNGSVYDHDDDDNEEANDCPDRPDDRREPDRADADERSQVGRSRAIKERGAGEGGDFVSEN